MIKFEMENEYSLELDMKEQLKKGIMFFDAILSFECFPQGRIMGYMPIQKDEQTQLNTLIKIIDKHCKAEKLPVNKLWKISTACNWTLFKNVTGKNTDFVDSTNGKLYFVQSDPRSVLEKTLTDQNGFGTDVYWEAA